MLVISDVAGLKLRLKPLGTVDVAIYIFKVEACRSQRIRFSITFLSFKKCTEASPKGVLPRLGGSHSVAWVGSGRLLLNWYLDWDDVAPLGGGEAAGVALLLTGLFVTL